jgi:hypothetical protein
MGNSNPTEEKLPQHLLEAIYKLVHQGASHQAICSVLGLKLEVVQQVLGKDLSRLTKLTTTIREKSKDQLVQTSPAILAENPSMSSELVMPNPKRKAKISEICKENTPQLYEDTLPAFIYSYNCSTDQLYRTSLVTGEQSTHHVRTYSSGRVVGVKCLEVASSSLVEGVLQQ